MLQNLSRRLFPGASALERRQKMASIVIAFVGALILVAVVAFIMVQVYGLSARTR
jgi:uncharacterized membrane protein YeaQ/YmgE (transglycosylase-associated protein family)